jgi:hypothetical protein
MSVLPIPLSINGLKRLRSSGMTRQTVSLEQAIQQGNFFLAQGNTLAAQQVYSQILTHFPDMQAPRLGLKSILNSRLNEVTEQGIQHSLAAIQQSNYFKHEAVKGWAYSLVIDHHYIDSGFEKCQAASPCRSDCFDPDDLTPGHAPDLYFTLIRQMKDVRERFRYLEQLTQEQTLSVLADSFIETPSEELEDETRQMFSSQAINVVILGAGLTGLAMANMLKTTFRDKINILVLENRVHTTHYKKPYTRNWLTNIPISVLLGVMDKDLTDVLATLGTDGFIGAPINIFETLMLLSCKKLGVKFLFRRSTDLSFLRETSLDIVFDATGNRLNEVSLDTFPEEQIQTKHAEIAVGRQLANGYARFGISPAPCREINKIELLAAENLLVPAHKQDPIKSAMIKITGIPISLLETLFSSIQHCNYDNRFYLWPGTLQHEINQALLIVNLTPSEFESLQNYLLAPIFLDVFLDHYADLHTLDKRFVDLMHTLVRDISGDYPVRIEPPFLYEPYMQEYPQAWKRLNGAPIIPIGDSIYNGHVKCGNGIGSHLPHLRFIHDALLKGQLFCH